MAIILEGFDNSGKSTLAGSLTWPVVHSGPRPETPRDLIRNLMVQHRIVHKDIVLDRITAISDMAYNPRPSRILSLYLMLMAKHPKATIIYCRPPMEKILDFSQHEVKGYDDDTWIQYIQENASVIVARYDDIMSTLPHLVFDWTNPSKEVMDKLTQLGALPQ